jgi:uncharacterized Zn finger protein
MALKKSKADFFKELSWDDLQEWAGNKILSRGQSYQRNHRVQELAQAKSGELIAWVQGEKRYATQVDSKRGELISTCTCPYGGTCKHAVAVVLEYLDFLKKNAEVPKIGEQDKRLLLVNKIADEDEEGDERDEWDDEEDEEHEEELDIDGTPPKRRLKSTPDALKGFLKYQTKEALISLLEDLAGKHSIIREDLQDRLDLSKGSVKRLVAAVRKEIHELSSEPAWRNHWNDEGYVPDYSRVKDRLESLLSKGHAAEVVILGKELLEAGTEQVEMSHDDGETGNEISSCLEVVLRALPQSSLSPVEQMLWVIDAELEDEYDLCYGSESFWKKKWKASDWSAVADILIERLNTLKTEKGEDGFSRDYRRDGLTNWIIRAFENSDRHEEIIPLCEQEAVKTRSYERLVNALITAKRFEEAEQWIHKGIQATQKDLPGIAKHLRGTLREMREKEGNWLKVAAFRVDDFLHAPSLEAFKEMRKASERAKVWPAVRSAALLYLETGKLPQTNPSWPLPEAGVTEKAEIRKSDFPITTVLIDIAIAEKRPEEVLRWYDNRKSKKDDFWSWHGYREDHIAGAIADQYPDRALTLWKGLAEREIAQTKPSAYETASGYLRKVREWLKKLKREPEWKDYLSKLRQANLRKRNFIEILDRLDNRPIIKT